MQGAQAVSPQVTQLRVIVFVLDVNDNPPKFPFKLRVEDVPEVRAGGRGARGRRAGLVAWALAWGTRGRGCRHHSPPSPGQ